ncbi:MAG: sigma-54 dependent transcriptional regulator [Candidatus Riflemargulisbacteria bacterium]
MPGSLIKKGNDFLKYWHEELRKEGREDLAAKFLPKQSEQLLKSIVDASQNINAEISENDFLSISDVLKSLNDFQEQNISNSDMVKYLESLLNTLEKLFPRVQNQDLLRFEKMLRSLIRFVQFQSEKENLLEQKILCLTNSDNNNILKMAGASKTISSLIEDIEPVLNNNVSVLIQGDTGTGKELTARAVYKNSIYRNGPFIALNCAAVPEDLIESELFGYKKGSFTDAISDRPGKIELADNGVLFLDEVNELSPKLQAKLLRVLQEKSVVRIGDIQERKIDFKLICSTNQDLKALVEQKKFREDLFYRINVYTVNLPPLRERKEDICPIAQYFLQIRTKEFHKDIAGFSEDAIKLMLAYPWPGNIRELDNIITRAVLRCKQKHISLKELDIYLSLENPASSMELKEIEKNHILYVLQKNNQNMAKTAKDLGITRTTLYSKIKDYSHNG